LTNRNTLEYILKKDRFIVVSGLFIMCILAWLYIIYLYRQMVHMNMDALFFAMPMSPSWTVVDFILLFFMWFVMMLAMMTPSVAPLILIFAMVNRQNKELKNPFVPAGYLLAGYFLVWAGFSLFATTLQWLLQQISLLNPEMETTNRTLGGIILLAAGIFQFTPLKQRCLNYCRTPVDFVHRKWKQGKRGALRMGIENGMYCLGCCWVLMTLLFVSGIMNLLWIALITLFVLIEKVLPKAKWVSFIAGSALIIYGTWVLVKSFF
jgi:predicted metal-binding membrane protein